MDIVIPYRFNRDTNDFELRYSLRSLERHGKGFDKVIIVGDSPHWCMTYNTKEDGLYYFDISNHEFNIYQKILCACKQGAISNDFILWNDDFFLVQNTCFKNYPYYSCGDLEWFLEGCNPNDNYSESALNTVKHLQKYEMPTYNFDCHFPIIYNKQKFLDSVTHCDWLKRNGYLIKSLYCNWNNIAPATIEDCKINKPLSEKEIWDYIRNRHIFSLGERGLTDTMKQFLAYMFPEKSRFEYDNAGTIG